MALNLSIHAIGAHAEIEQCARMMEASEPWLTLGRGYETGLAMLQDASRERHLALLDGEAAGFVVLLMRGALVGYLQTICVAPGFRGRGIGRALMEYAEALVFEQHPNLFLTVSKFNQAARAFYQRLGYETIGELEDYIVAGQSEILMRKTRGPLRGYARRSR
jgi:ribosomal protein S18 acetylase RimI-like enzyme